MTQHSALSTRELIHALVHTSPLTTHYPPLVEEACERLKAPPTDREKALAEALALARPYVESASRSLYDGTQGHQMREEAKARLSKIDTALTAPTPAAPTDGPSDKERLDWLSKNTSFEFEIWAPGTPMHQRKNFATGVVLRYVIDAARAAMEAQP